MKIILISLFLLCSNYTFAKEELSFHSLKLGNTNIEISKNCSSKCMATIKLLALDKKIIQNIQKDIYGGKNYGNILCRKIFNAEVRYIKDKKNNEFHLCFFKDKSYIKSGEIDYYISNEQLF